MPGIKQTQEIVAATGALILWWRQVNADGKVSWLEWIGMAKHIPAIRDAIDGVGEAVGELKDLDENEAGELRAAISAILVQNGISHRHADITDELLGLAFEAATVVMKIKAMPPTALPA